MAPRRCFAPICQRDVMASGAPMMHGYRLFARPAGGEGVCARWARSSLASEMEPLRGALAHERFEAERELLGGGVEIGGAGVAVDPDRSAAEDLVAPVRRARDEDRH